MTTEITDDQQYISLISHMDRLFDDYEANKLRIDQLAPLLKKYEDTSAHFAAFNQSLAGVSHIQALIQVLMDQHSLSILDLQNELGGPDEVTAILSGQLTPTLEQLLALSKRFGFEMHSFNYSEL